MKEKDAWGTLTSVGELFIRYWRWAAGWSTSERLAASLDNNDFRTLVRGALAKDDEEDLLSTLGRVIPRHDDAIARPQILALLQEFDDAFLRIHPRSLTASGEIRAGRVPAWLRRYREQRNSDGFYAESGDFRLLPRGPLCRPPRDTFASHAETLADRFSALTVYSKSIRHKQMPLTIEHVVVSLSATHGISPVERRGHERVVSIPMMEQDTDLSLDLRETGGREYVSYSLSSDIKAVERLSRAAIAGEGGAILIAPEFAVDAAAAEEVAKYLQRNNAVGYGLVAAGTGDLAAPNGAFPFNEMRLMNGRGEVLWRQRKIWPAFISGDVARQLSLQPKSDQIYEASSSCKTLVVADVDALGRVMVLICQDFKMQAASSLIEDLQPDWVIVPVMDSGVSASRWSHQRAFELSEITQSRFLICSGLSMAKRMKYDDPIQCLCAMGPKAPSDPLDLERAFTAESAKGAHGAQYAELTWRSAGWQQSTLSATPRTERVK